MQEVDQVFSNFETKSVHLDLLKGPLSTSGLDSFPREVVSPNGSRERDPFSLVLLEQYRPGWERQRGGERWISQKRALDWGVRRLILIFTFVVNHHYSCEPVT